MAREITGTLLDDKVVKLTGFGAFDFRKRAERLGRNPKTGKPLLVKVSV